MFPKKNHSGHRFDPHPTGNAGTAADVRAQPRRQEMERIDKKTDPRHKFILFMKEIRIKQWF
jgi:hypothetical protein